MSVFPKGVGRDEKLTLNKNTKLLRLPFTKCLRGSWVTCRLANVTKILEAFAIKCDSKFNVYQRLLVIRVAISLYL